MKYFFDQIKCDQGPWLCLRRVLWCHLVWRCLPLTCAVFLVLVVLLKSLIIDQTVINIMQLNYILTNHQ